MKSLKQQLLNPAARSTVSVLLFGTEFQVRRQTAAYIDNLHNQLKVAEEAEDGGRALNTQAAQFILDSLLDEQGKPMSASVKVDSILSAYTPVELQEAQGAILTANYATGEGAQAVKKD